jgi:hypothetical protein
VKARFDAQTEEIYVTDTNERFDQPFCPGIDFPPGVLDPGDRKRMGGDSPGNGRTG